MKICCLVSQSERAALEDSAIAKINQEGYTAAVATWFFPLCKECQNKYPTEKEYENKIQNSHASSAQLMKLWATSMDGVANQIETILQGIKDWENNDDMIREMTCMIVQARKIAKKGRNMKQDDLPKTVRDEFYLQLFSAGKDMNSCSILRIEGNDTKKIRKNGNKIKTGISFRLITKRCIFPIPKVASQLVTTINKQKYFLSFMILIFQISFLKKKGNKNQKRSLIVLIDGIFPFDKVSNTRKFSV